jgi:molecular chaperone GrpE (heat shock protein)
MSEMALDKLLEIVDHYEKQYKESQDAVRRYAADVRNVTKKLDLAVDIILALRKEITLIPTKIQKQIDSLTKGGYRG